MGSSIGDFRHGTVEVTEKGLPVLFLASGGKQARETQTHIRFLENIGADIYLITDCGKYCHPCTEHRILIEDAGKNVLLPSISWFLFSFWRNRQREGKDWK